MNMNRHKYLDASPPIYASSRDHLDKSAFQKTLPVLAARVPAAKTGVILKAEVMRSALMDLPKVRTVVPDPFDPEGNRLVLLRLSDKAELPHDAVQFLAQEASGLVNYDVNLDYNYWTADEILQSFLPEELREGSPTGFAMTGHIAHVNLNDEYLPYKHVIGQLILEKNPRVKTVVNKLKLIDHQFRFFKMELIAGEPNYVVEHHESNCRFTFDFSQVYWNSRLHTEHDRLVQSFQPEDIIADVFAGVGPFAVPAAKKGCAVLANDLNPKSAKYLEQNVSDLVRVTCEDGRDFIKSIITRVFDQPFAPYTGPALSRVQAEKERRHTQRMGTTSQTTTREPTTSRRRVSHFVMNLPDSAIQFLDAFRGILIDEERDLRRTYDIMPMVHCHCFTRELEASKAEEDITTIVAEMLGHPVTDDVSFHFVRSVAPKKEMYCISFRLPSEVAFMKS